MVFAEKGQYSVYVLNTSFDVQRRHNRVTFEYPLIGQIGSHVFSCPWGCTGRCSLNLDLGGRGTIF